MSSRPRAFTLLETVMVLSITAIIVAAGVPQATAIIQQQRLHAARQSIHQQLEAVLKEGRNRLVPVEIDVDADGIYYTFNEHAGIGLAFNGCGGSPGLSTACRLRATTTCSILTHEKVTDVCLPVRAAIDSMLRAGDMDSVIDTWRSGAIGPYVVENLSDTFGQPVHGAPSRIAHDDIRFSESFVEGGGAFDARFAVTPLGRVLSGYTNARTLLMTDSLGVQTKLQILDSGIVRIVP